jgi:DNA adenine methylase
MKVFQPFPYQGSKRKIAEHITNLLPENTHRLIEPFAGSAAVSLRALVEKRASRILLNDSNAPLMALWDAIAHHPEELADDYERLWHEQLGDRRAFYDEIRDRFNEDHQPEHLLYLLARCVKASVRYNSQGEFNQSPDNRRKGTRPKTMRKRIRHAAQLMQGRVEITSNDYQDTLATASPQDVVYMDPPYQGVCANRDPRYHEGVRFDDFVQSLEGLNQRDIGFILSYDGRTGEQEYGQPLPNSLDLKHAEIDAGRSSQATLLGRDAKTFESLYLSPALAERVSVSSPDSGDANKQLAIFNDSAWENKTIPTGSSTD